MVEEDAIVIWIVARTRNNRHYYFRRLHHNGVLAESRNDKRHFERTGQFLFKVAP
jgi:hypothetical protein